MSLPQPGGSAETADQKKRRACDECRTRKLACSKEGDGCRRCKREGIACVYSAQKPMGRPRKRARVDDDETDGAVARDAEAGPGGIPALSLPRHDLATGGDVGLSVLADQATSPGFNFFDFIGVNEPNNQEISSFYQQQTATTLPSPPGLMSIPPSAAAAAMTGLPTHGSSESYQKLFPRGLFGVNFSNIDFSTSPSAAALADGGMPASNGVLANGVPTPPSNMTSPGGSGSDTPALTAAGSKSTPGESPAAAATPPVSTRPMVTPGLTPGLAANSPHGWLPRHPVAILPPSPGYHRAQPAILPPSPKLQPLQQQQHPPRQQQQQQQQPAHHPPPRPHPAPAPAAAPAPAPAAPLPEETAGGDQPMLLGDIPTTSTVDAYSKSSAAWLLTAPNRVCGCLARLYLALDSLQHLPAEIGPAMSVARNAAHTAHDTILCPSCSPPAPNLFDRPPLQAFQNLMILGALLPSLAHTYRRIVAMVDEEAARAAAAKVRLSVSLTEYGGVWGHMARWDNFCAQASALDNSMVEPPLWRLVVRALLKMDVYGIHLDRDELKADDDDIGAAARDPEGGGEKEKAKKGAGLSRDAAEASAGINVPNTAGGFFMVPVHFGLKDIAEMMEARAKMRHRFMDAAYNAGLLKGTEADPGCGYTPLPPGEKHNCEKVIEMAKKEIDKLVIV